MQAKFSNYLWLNQAFEQIRLTHQRGKLAHGIMFVAPEGSGKAEFSNKLAAALLCLQSNESLSPACGTCKNCLLVESQTHPDLTVLDRLVDNKGKQKSSIGIDQVRDLSEKLVETPQMGGWRIAIIASVEKLTRGAFNALLKTLEEPGNNTLLMMLADNSHRVPATIKSRCQLIPFDLAGRQLSQWLIDQTNVSEEEVQLALEACHYSPFRALEYLQTDEASSVRELNQDLDKVLATTLSANQFITKHAAKNSQLWAQIANYFQKVQLSILDSNLQTYSSVPSSLPAKIYQQLLEYNRAQCVGSNLQSNLQLETILIPWFELGRKIVHYSNR